MKVTVCHRTDQQFRAYEPGDPITAVYDYEHPTGPNFTTHDARQVAEQAFRMFNGQPTTSWERDHADRYYAAQNRSLSVGDLVVIGEIALACEPAGWAFVTIPSQAES
jgi:hypothetical protein